ncbi:hypothetical protein PPL_07572 [Heterostelium album PN500]|uniref:Cyclin N-terminal domain-containing protein n=1 Tax=Heterostelium pallidum (strain ATCC 26659 / Pp 5 / PN500) TaxID=670386 RepID=D3BGC1_HETP5|nr:hypothetical protein PPL_07572 [Heterostelium album PN500]EFA79521.1 hypothetical protein PPL_07572 [Heterostelium album PN500]|eukprot:XP_020431642.1 hypothetical protein PPL_07572 [Heterostelium album PN500]
MNTLSFYPSNPFVHPYENIYQQAQQYPPSQQPSQQHFQDCSSNNQHFQNNNYGQKLSEQPNMMYQQPTATTTHYYKNGYNPFYTNHATSAMTANSATGISNQHHFIQPQQTKYSTTTNNNINNYQSSHINGSSSSNKIIDKSDSSKVSSTNTTRKPRSNEHPNSQSLESWNFSGESTSRIYQTLNRRAEFHKNSAHSRIVFVKKVFGWLAVHDREYLNNHKTVDLVVAISDIINMIISLIELHRAPSFVIYLIILASDRFVERTGINHHQIFNLLLTSSIVNLKFWNESIYIQNKTIADIFSFNVKDLNTMERRFLFGLDYNLCVTEEQLQNYIEQIKSQSISNMVLSSLEKEGNYS